MTEEPRPDRRRALPEERTGYRSGDPSFRPSTEGESRAPVEDPPVPCDLCGAPMIDRHCKLTCPRCGYQRDCSDP